jgi:hypothetical protein
MIHWTGSNAAWCISAVFSIVPRGKVKLVAAMLKAIHPKEDIETSAFETLVYMDFPREHW